MIQEFVGEFMKSGAGADLVSKLAGQGLDATQAQGAISATAEGALEQLRGGQGGGLGAVVGGLLGGTGGGLGSLLGTPAAAGHGASSGLTSLIQPIASFVSTKTGLEHATALSVVSTVLPKIVELIQSKMGGVTPGESGGLGGLTSKLGGGVF